jgi:GT2 family glycosyltransferase
MSETPKSLYASVVTVNYKTSALVHRLERLVSQVAGIEIVVVDNSEDFTPQYGSTQTLRPGRNIGFGRGCNFGARASRAPLLLFVNPDVELTPADLEQLVAFSRWGPEGKIWGPAILDKRGFVTALRKPGRMGLIFRRESYRVPDTKEPIAETYVSGACLAIQKRLFTEVGGFREDIFMYAEDLDLCERIGRIGAGSFVCPGVVVSHRGGGSTSGLTSRVLRLLRSIRGHYRYLTKGGHSRISAFVNSIHLASGLRI